LETFMRTFVGGATLLSALFVFAAAAKAAPWCARYSTGFTDCRGFYSFEQCQASISGVGGVCTRNPGEPTYRTVRRRYRY
jgi:hypothetical protein